jgi:hypothetical protein
MSFSTDEQEMFEKAIRRHFGDLVSRGLQLSSVAVRTDPLTGEKLVADVGNPSTGRGITFTLLRTPDGSRQALTTFLRKGGTGGFMVSTYLRHIGAPKMVIQQLALSTPNGQLSDLIDSVLQSTRSVIDEHLISALTGGPWPAVPVDWGDYK